LYQPEKAPERKERKMTFNNAAGGGKMSLRKGERKDSSTRLRGDAKKGVKCILLCYAFGKRKEYSIFHAWGEQFIKKGRLTGGSLNLVTIKGKIFDPVLLSIRREREEGGENVDHEVGKPSAGKARYLHSAK